MTQLIEKKQISNFSDDKDEIIVLLVEDNPDDIKLINWMLTREKNADNDLTRYSMTFVDSIQLALEKINSANYDIILLDLLLPDSQGIDTFIKMQANAPGIPIIVLSGSDDELLAVQAVRIGAQDYLTKGHVDGNILKRSIRYAIERKSLEEEQVWHTSVNAALSDLSEAIITSRSIDDISRLFTKQAKYFTSSTICITGYRNQQNDSINCIISDNQSIDLKNLTTNPIDIPLSNDLIRSICSSNQSQIINQSDEIIFTTGSILDNYKISKLLAVPAIIDGRSVGIIILANQVHDYATKDQQFVERLAALFALALQRQQSQDALKASEERYRVVTQSANDAIITVDSDGIIISWNVGATNIFGFNEKEMIGHSIGQIVPDKDAGNIDDFFSKYIQSDNAGPNRMMEFSGLRKDGKEIPTEISVTGWETKEGYFYTGIIRDISRRKQLENQFRQAQKMEAVGQLAGGIAHDFNNILTGIIGFAELAANSIETDIPAQKYIKSIIRKSDDAATLVKQILAFSRKQILDIKLLDMNDSVISITNFIERVIGEDIELSTNLADDLHYVNVDSTALEQIITNLCVNARVAMPNGGKLILSTSNRTIDESSNQETPYVTPGDYSILTITDTGYGIAPQALQHIYEPFYTTNEVGQGSGLGLAMVYGLVQQHRAYIHCTSVLEKGTSFQIFFPSAHAEPDQKNKIVIEHVVGGTETILMVEDEVDLIILTKSMLNQYGYTVLTAANGIDGFKVYQKNRDQISIILTDIVMPKEGGIELYKKIQADNPNMKFLFITGYASGLADKELAIGKDWDVLAKPYKRAQLAKKVRQIIDLKQPRQ